MPLTLSSISWLFEWIQMPTWKFAGLIFFNGLWIPLFYVFWKEMWESFQFWTNGINKSLHRKLVYLAVDVPRETEQTPAAMEAIFNQVAGAHGTETWVSSRWGGGYQEWFSFEIVSLEGYVQYIIQTPEPFRDLIEASIYAQYPDAEISEVKDYTPDVPSKWPDEKLKFFGTDYLLAKEDAYPIRTYNEFEDKVLGEYIDPMAGLLEIMSKIGKGEQIWYQILIKPIVDPDWIPEAQKVINKMIDRKDPEEKAKGGWRLLELLGWPIHFASEVLGEAFGWELGETAEQDRGTDLAKSPMFKLTPGERTVLEDTERKTGKIAYRCRIRVVYIAEKEIFSKARGLGPVVGAIKQFNDSSKNWLKVGKKSWTKTNYFFKKARMYQRENAYYKAYKGRSLYAGDAPGGFVLNSEELATMYHFPMASVKAPLLKRAGAKKSEPPPSLPIGVIGGSVVNISEAPEPPAGEAPPISATSAPEPPAMPEVIAEESVSEEKKLPSVADLAADEGVAVYSDADVHFVDIPEDPPDDDRAE